VFADEAAGLYERATTTVLKNCTLLYFAYADFEEVQQLILTEIKWLLETFCFVDFYFFWSEVTYKFGVIYIYF